MRNKRWPWVAAAALVVISLAAVVAATHRGSHRSTPSVSGPSTSTSISTSTTTVASSAPATWSVTAMKTSGTIGSMQWTADRLSVTKGGARTPVAGVIEDALNSQVDASITTASTPSDFPTLRYVVTLDRVAVLGDRYLTVTLDEYSDSGGAHGLTTPKTTSFDLDSGKTFDPITLFRSTQAGFDAISAAVRPRVVRYVGTPFDGLAPTSTNFHTLSPRADGLLVTFDDYQVAAYSEGIIDVLVPWSELDAVLVPGAVPAGDRRTASYTIGSFFDSFEGFLPPPPTELGALDNGVLVNLHDQNEWVLATVESTGEVVVMHSPFDTKSEPTTWIVDTRGQWPLSCASAPVQLLRTQGLPC